jgi:hypothetical protein
MTRTKKKIFAVLGMSALVATAALIAIPAEAAVECPMNKVCLYADANFGGDGAWLDGPNAELPGFMNDRASSYRNYTGDQYCAYQDSAFRGPVVFVLTPHMAIGMVPGGGNDKASSVGKC